MRMPDLDRRRIRVLVIDDSPVVLKWCRLVLESAGYEMLAHDSVMGTSVRILRDKPDLVLLDVGMPVLQGDDVMEFIRPLGLKTPVFLFSSHPADELERRAAKAGCDGYIRKTEDSALFLSQVEAALQTGSD
jgi:two-component system KDP operon response regulator KdpE